MTIVQVGPEIANPTHHVSLTDGKKTIGLTLCDSAGNATALAITRAPVPRTALKTTTGNQSYSDFEPPWTPIAQDDWSGGRGLLDFDEDTTRFYDSYRANTMAGNIILGPQEVYTSGYRSRNANLPGSVAWTALIGETQYLAVKFTATTYTTGNVYLLVRRTGTPTAVMTVSLCSDSGGNPGSILESVTLSTTTVTDITSELRKLTLSEAISNGLDYWIKVYSTGEDDQNHWSVGVKASAGTTKESDDNSSWADSANDLYYLITTPDVGMRTKLFRYKSAQYLVRTVGSNVNVYINGDRGAADSNAGNLTKVIDATKSWETNEWTGCIVQIIEGTGRAESKPWRTILANNATRLTVDEAWVIEHDQTTAYVIIGANTWKEITGHGLTAFPTDILTVNEICYISQGASVIMRKMRWTAAAGYEWAANSTSTVDFLCTVYDATDGLVLYASLNTTRKIYKANSITAWAVDLAFSDVVTFQDDYGNITGLTEYGDTNKTLWIMREGAVFYLSAGKALEIPLSEMHNAMEYTNGIANLVHNVYLYFNLGSGIERYYNRTLDDVGPNADEGMPSGRQGVISKMAGYPGKYLAAIDAGASGYSSILINNGVGWHELYRAPYGERIQDMQFQMVPGSSLDRLWVQVGEHILWLGFPSLTSNPQRDSNYRYTHEGTVITGYIFSGLYDVYKFYKSLKLFTEGLAADEQVVDIEYQVDEETGWTPIIDTFVESPMQEINLVNTLGITGKRLRYRIRVQTNSNTITPVVKGAILESITRVPVKYSFSLPHRIMDNDIDLNGEPETIDADDKQIQLDAWATNLTPLTMRCVYKPFDDKTVFIDPATLVPNREHTPGFTARLTVTEV